MEEVPVYIQIVYVVVVLTISTYWMYQFTKES